MSCGRAHVSFANVDRTKAFQMNILLSCFGRQWKTIENTAVEVIEHGLCVDLELNYRAESSEQKQRATLWWQRERESMEESLKQNVCCRFFSFSRLGREKSVKNRRLYDHDANIMDSHVPSFHTIVVVIVFFLRIQVDTFFPFHPQ